MAVTKECVHDKDMTGGNTPNSNPPVFDPSVPLPSMDKDGQGRVQTVNYNYSNKGAHVALNQYSVNGNGLNTQTNAIDMNKDGLKISSDQSTFGSSGYNNKYHADIYQPGMHTRVDQSSSLNTGGYNSNSLVQKDGIFTSSRGQYSNKIDKSGFQANGKESATFCCLFNVQRQASLQVGSTTSASENINCCGKNLGCACNICAGDCKCDCCGLIDCLGSCLKGVGNCITKLPECCDKIGSCCTAIKDCAGPCIQCMGEVVSCVSKMKC